MLTLIHWICGMLKSFTIPTPDGKSKYLTRFKFWGALPGEGGLQGTVIYTSSIAPMRIASFRQPSLDLVLFF